MPTLPLLSRPQVEHLELSEDMRETSNRQEDHTEPEGRPLLSDDEEEGTFETPKTSSPISSLWRLRWSFFLFGTINNGDSFILYRFTSQKFNFSLIPHEVLYVIILSAALDLVPQGTPKVRVIFTTKLL